MTELENATSKTASPKGSAHPSPTTRRPELVALRSRLQRTTRPAQSANHQDRSVPPTSTTDSLPCRPRSDCTRSQRRRRRREARLPERRSDNDCRTSQFRRPIWLPRHHEHERANGSGRAPLPLAHQHYDRHRPREGLRELLGTALHSSFSGSCPSPARTPPTPASVGGWASSHELRDSPPALSPASSPLSN